MMTLAQLLKLAQALGLPAVDLNKLKQLVIDEGIERGQEFVRTWVRGTLEKAQPAILANLKTKAPIDGQKRRDKDGIEMSDAEFFIHEADYLLVKRIIRKGGAAKDAVRDRHFPKVASRVLAAVPEGQLRTQENLLNRLIHEEVELTFA
jgi:hypothetical protein